MLNISRDVMKFEDSTWHFPYTNNTKFNDDSSVVCKIVGLFAARLIIVSALIGKDDDWLFIFDNVPLHILNIRLVLYIITPLHNDHYNWMYLVLCDLTAEIGMIYIRCEN